MSKRDKLVVGELFPGLTREPLSFEIDVSDKTSAQGNCYWHGVWLGNYILTHANKRFAGTEDA